MALTKRQKEVLDFIAGFVDDNGYCPSYEEIARGLELASLATVHKHISVLEAKSYLKRGNVFRLVSHHDLPHCPVPPHRCRVPVPRWNRFPLAVRG